MTEQPHVSPLLSFDVSICGLLEIADFANRDISHAISILDPGWPDPKEFLAFTGCRREIFHFHDIIDPQTGWVAPTKQDVVRILGIGERLQRESVRHLLVHCHMGVSRSVSTVAMLLAQFNPGREDDAFRQITRIRPRSWPNSRMIEIADELLGRSGRLVTAMRAHHARMITAWPDLAEEIRTSSLRHREYTLALSKAGTGQPKAAK